MDSQCTYLAKFLRVQREILSRHIDEHLWCRHIADDEEGKADFLNEFGWLMRELYCGFACENRHNCEIATAFLPSTDPVAFLEAQMEILSRHIAEHKWCRGIADDQAGIADFLKEYGWLVRELYCGFACPKRHNCEFAKVFLPKTDHD